MKLSHVSGRFASHCCGGNIISVCYEWKPRTRPIKQPCSLWEPGLTFYELSLAKPWVLPSHINLKIWPQRRSQEKVLVTPQSQWATPCLFSTCSSVLAPRGRDSGLDVIFLQVSGSIYCLWVRHRTEARNSVQRVLQSWSKAWRAGSGAACVARPHSRQQSCPHWRRLGGLQGTGQKAVCLTFEPTAVWFQLSTK